MKVTTFALSHVGKVRKRNEDSVLIDPDGQFALLADGMGGHRGGQEASRMTVQMMAAVMNETIEEVTDEPEFQPLCNDEELEKQDSFFRDKLSLAFRSSSAQVAHRGHEFPELENMGTTLVLWFHWNQHVYVAHVGDSRAYLLREGSLFQVTMDHVLFTDQIREGMMRDQALHLPLGHVLIRNIGVMPATSPDIVRFDVLPGDLWLLSSDGLFNKIPHKDICAVLVKSKLSLAERSKILVERAYMAGGEDNISVVLIEMSKQ